MNEWLTVDTFMKVGFPVLMCGYLIFRFEKVIEANTSAIKEMSDKFIDYLCKRDGDC